ncbi:MAG: hypothetical protein FWG25_03710 [Promicromonosporaceae bacterium]|nr:hypothetical protein [Promicromonosporaceae bacterium]
MNPERQQALVQEWANLNQRITALEERRDQIKAALTETLPTGTTEIAGLKVSITRPNRLNNQAIEKAYPIHEYPDLYRASLDTASVRRFISPVILETEFTQPATKPTITLK